MGVRKSAAFVAAGLCSPVYCPLPKGSGERRPDEKSVSARMSKRGRAYLALGKQQLHAPPRLGMCNGVVAALFIVTHGVETGRWRRR